MSDISVTYLGLPLRSPVVVSSSPMTASADSIVRLEGAGAGAVVLKSIFEEQIALEAESLERYYSGYPETADYLSAYVGSSYRSDYIELIKRTKKLVSIPVIASINCISEGNWVNYAKEIEAAGADALELNIFFMPVSADASSASIEDKYLRVMEKVSAHVSIPLSVKLTFRFTNVLRMARELHTRKARGLVLYNRMFEPDIDIEQVAYTKAQELSSPLELYNSLRNAAQLSAMLPGADIAVSTGVHSGPDAVKAILAGAKVVYVCSTVMQGGPGAITKINHFIESWMRRHRYGTVDDFRGLLNSRDGDPSETFQRVQYMKYFPSEIR